MGVTKINILEISNKKNGRRAVTVILHEIHNDNSKFNKNGITWIEKYCVMAMESITGMSLTAEFLDEGRTQINGHGNTGIKDNMPIFENASVLGTFKSAEIKNIKIGDETKRVMLGYAELDEMRYKNFTEKLGKSYLSGEKIFGSVEIIGLSENNNEIKYADSYKPQGRVPTRFRYSGFALLGIEPADSAAKILEINNKEERHMDEIKKLLEGLKEKLDKSEKYKQEFKVSEENSKKLEDEILRLKAENEAITLELKALKEENEKCKSETNEVKEELNKSKSDQEIANLENELKQFTENQIEFVKDEIEKFKSDPVNSELNAEGIVNKIFTEIGKQSLESKKISEQNNKIDFFGEIADVTTCANFSIF